MKKRGWTVRRGAGFMIVGLLTVSGCHDDDSGPGGLSVMTFNMYYGFDVGPLLSAEDPAEIPVLAAEAYQRLLSTKSLERAAALADEIHGSAPHLVGLQEVALFRIQSPGDAVAGGTVPAEDLLLDPLAALLDELAVRGLEYRIAASVQNVDIELPMATGPETFDDIRLTDRDVILARRDVQTSNATAGNYAARLPLPNLGTEIPRGYAAVDAAIGGGAGVRFVTTHLEDLPFLDVQFAQAQELASILEGATRPVVLVGDFNSPAPSGDTYTFLESLGYEDAWTRAYGQLEGPTWGHAPDLLNPDADLTIRIDWILVRHSPNLRLPALLSSFAERWGDDPADRTPSGLWPSDHAAVIAHLYLNHGRGGRGGWRE